MIPDFVDKFFNLFVWEVWNFKDFEDKLNMSRRCKFMKLNKIQIKCFYAFQFPERPAALCFVVAGAHRAHRATQGYTGLQDKWDFYFSKSALYLSAGRYHDMAGWRSGRYSDWPFEMSSKNNLNVSDFDVEVEICGKMCWLFHQAIIYLVRSN